MRKAFYIFTFFVLALCFLAFEILGGEMLLSANAAETGISTDALAYILIEPNTKTVLKEHNADAKLPIASITKLMTIRLALKAIDAGSLALDGKTVVSKHAAEQTGSQAFLDENSEYTIEDLLKSTIIVSANDSAMALAEAVAGTEQEFVRQMNEEASVLGMSDTHFENPTGLPAAGHFSTARDIAILTNVVCTNPVYKRYAQIYLDELVHPSSRKTQLASTSKKFKHFQGFEGGKTGHTNEAGYCFAAAAKRGDMKLVAVVLGAKTSDMRFDTTKQLLDYGFSNYKTIDVLSTDKPVKSVPLKFATQQEVELFAKEPFTVFAKKEDKHSFETKVVLTKTKVPFYEKEPVGVVQVVADDKVIFETELVTHNAVDHVGYFKVLKSIARSF